MKELEDVSRRTQREPEQSALNAEIAKRMALLCVQQIDGIRELVELHRTGFDVPDIRAVLHDELITLFSFNDTQLTGVGPIRGLGHTLGFLPTIVLMYDNHAHQEIAKLLGVHAGPVLALPIHTDDSSMLAVAALDHPENGAEAVTIGTFYYFDREGNYAKTSALPHGIDDVRPNLFKTTSEFGKLVASEMTPGDFELAGVAVMAVHAKLQTLAAGA